MTYALSMGLHSATAVAQTISFVTTRVPTSTIEPNLEIRGNTNVLGLNDIGQYVGSFGERNWTIWGTPHGFIHGSTDTGPLQGIGSASRSPEGYRLGWIQGTRYADPDYRYFDLVPASGTSDFNDRVSQPNAINNAGIVVGNLSTDWLGRGPHQAYAYNTVTRELTVLAVPGAVSSMATDINNVGQIVGNFVDSAGKDRGFLFSNGNYTVIDRPGYANGGTKLAGINDTGTIVGSSNDFGNGSSFILRSGVFTDFNANGLYTVAADINNSEQIVGWVGVTGLRRGFFYEAGQSIILDLAEDGNSTYANTINNNGVIGGTYGNGLGFLGTVTSVPESSTISLMVSGIFLALPFWHRILMGRKLKDSPEA